MTTKEAAEAMTTINIVFHIERADEDEVVWWIESPDLAGFYAAAGDVVEARVAALAALADLGYGDATVIEHLEDHSPVLVLSGGR